MIEKEETFEDLFNSRLIFVRALSSLLIDGRGVFLELDDTNIKPKKIIVHKSNNMINVLDASERTDLKNGDWIEMINEDNIIN